MKHSPYFNIRNIFGAFMMLSALSLYCASSMVHAQGLQQGDNKNIFKTNARASGPTRLITSDRKIIQLWGVEAVEVADPVLNLRARTDLENKIGGAQVECEWRSRQGNDLFAQCVNQEDDDLGLFMIQNGYAIANRSVIYNTVFEDAYIQAESQAKTQSKGIWGQNSGMAGISLDQNSWLLGVGLAVFIIMVGAFTYLSIRIMRGFGRVIDAQNDNVQMMSRERKLRDKERNIVAIMLDSELKANKAKIEAYIVVYEEMLRGLQDPIKTPKYKKTGDILQRQPALDRSVFDRNTDKVDILGRRVASELVHFYARIKTNPEYTNIEPDEEQLDVVKMVQESLDGAKRLNKMADNLIESFNSIGLSSDLPEID